MPLQGSLLKKCMNSVSYIDPEHSYVLKQSDITKNVHFDSTSKVYVGNDVQAKRVMISLYMQISTLHKTSRTLHN